MNRHEGHGGRDSAREIAAAVRRRKRSAEEVVEECLDRIEEVDPLIDAFREVYADEALAAAAGIDRRVADGDDPGPLSGVPVALKDNIATTLGRTSCGSRMLEAYRSPFTATAVARLLAAGAVVVGKTRCDEFAMGSSTEHCCFGPARNPWDRERVPGGSSGGSAAAVAAGLVPVALGSETGGSIRQPAAMCGVVGVKPSYGRVSRHGLVAFGSSLDQIGPLAATVSDAALLLSIMAGFDRHDSTSSPQPVPEYPALIDAPIEGLTVAVASSALHEGNDPAVNTAVEQAIAALRDMGATILEIDLELTDYGISTYYVIATAEASSNLARFDGVRYGRRAAGAADLADLYERSRSEGFGPEVQRRIMLGTYVLSAGYYDAYYRRALQVRRLIKEEYDRVFARCDALIGPTAPTPAFPLGQKTDPLSMYLCDVYTVNANLAGICALSLPGEGGELPVGVQIQCPAYAEATMFRVARMLERARAAPLPLPPLAAGGRNVR